MPPSSRSREKLSGSYARQVERDKQLAMAHSREAMCTHFTMTRVYSDDVACSMCLQRGQFGWLYRCTQDRELILEDFAKRGGLHIFAIDDMYKDFDLGDLQRKKGPEERSKGPMAAVFEELTGAQLESYSGAQIAQILKQRDHVLTVARLQAAENEARKSVRPDIFQKNGSQVKEDKSKKPWLPAFDTECLFKICHRCRPTSMERSFLSLNALSKGEIPLSAVTGFGFQMIGKRPVIPKNVAMQLGLKPNPLPRAASPTSPPDHTGLGIDLDYTPHTPPTPVLKHSLLPASTYLPLNSFNPPPRSSSLLHKRLPTVPPTPFDDTDGADITFGSAEISHAYDSSAMTRSHNHESSATGEEPSGIGRPLDNAERANLKRALKTNTEYLAYKKAFHKEDAYKGAFSLHPDIRPADTPPNSPKSVNRDYHPTTGAEKGRSDKSLRVNQEWRQSLFGNPIWDTSSSEDEDADGDGDGGDPVAVSHEKEMDVTMDGTDTHALQAPTMLGVGEHTEMEILEAVEHRFGEEPLAVAHGVAVTEEAVELHVPDLITQF